MRSAIVLSVIVVSSVELLVSQPNPTGDPPMTPQASALFGSYTTAWDTTASLPPLYVAARFGDPTLVRPRLGQGAFRVLVTDSYHRRCSVTGETTLPALDAAHIRPYGAGGSQDASNGLLLRRDLHSLFDAGYVTVTPQRRFEVSRRVREEFLNDRHYYALHGQEISLPNLAERRPEHEELAWHNEHVFLS